MSVRDLCKIALLTANFNEGGVLMSGLFSKAQKLSARGLICTCFLMSSNVLSETRPPSHPQTWPGEGVLRDDPNRPVTAISRDLGITPDQFRRCFNDVHPAQQGTRPDPERVRANKSVLLACIQGGNPSITNDQLDTVMDRYRPGGHAAQEPN